MLWKTSIFDVRLTRYCEVKYPNTSKTRLLCITTFCSRKKCIHPSKHGLFIFLTHLASIVPVNKWKCLEIERESCCEIREKEAVYGWQGSEDVLELSGAGNCQFFLWLWPPRKKKDLGLMWKSMKAKTLKKRERAREGRAISVRAELAAKPTVLSIYPFSTARRSGGHPLRASGPFTHSTGTSKNICAWEVFPLNG